MHNMLFVPMSEQFQHRECNKSLALGPSCTVVSVLRSVWDAAVAPASPEAPWALRWRSSSRPRRRKSRDELRDLLRRNDSYDPQCWHLSAARSSGISERHDLPCLSKPKATCKCSALIRILRLTVRGSRSELSVQRDPDV